MKRFLASFSCAVLCSALALCQTSISVSTRVNGTQGTMHFGPATRFSRVLSIAGAPFSAEEVDEDVQTLADGTHIRHTTPGMKMYRASMRRTRTERQALPQPVEIHAKTPKVPTLVEINDPVAHVRYVFDLDEAVAHRQELPAEHSRVAPAQGQPGHAVVAVATGLNAVGGGMGDAGTSSTIAGRSAAPSIATRQGVDDETRPQTTTEDLGTQIIEGIQAEGMRITTTWPIGSMGNDRPITEISEHWRSPDLKEDILRKSDDPRYGERTHKLVNLTRSEPDPSLFEPPPGYTVKAEAGEFTIEWNNTR